MKKGLGRIVSGVLCAAILFSFVACGNGGNGGGGGGGGIEYGRYVETDITPPGLKGYISTMATFGDTIDIVAYDYGGEENNWRTTYLRYRSTDGGATWTQPDMTWTEEYTRVYDWTEGEPEQSSYISGSLAIQENGDIICVTQTNYYSEETSTSETFAWRVDINGNKTPFGLEGLDKMNQPNTYGGMGEFMSLSGNRLFVSFYLYFYSETGEYLRDESSSAIFDATTGQKLLDISGGDNWIIFYNDDVMLLEDNYGEKKYISLHDGHEVTGGLPQYEDIIKAGAYPNTSNTILDEENNLYLLDSQKGLLKFTTEGAEPVEEDTKGYEQLMEPLNYSYGSPLRYTSRLSKDDKGNLLISTTSSVANNESRLYRYHWDDEAVASTGEHIKVFSVYDSQTARLALSQYKVAHPEVTVSFDYALERYYGSDDTDIMTIDDVLRNLNNEMLTGNGPDVLILDDLPLQSYIDKGILEDITQAIEGTDIYDSLLAPFYSGGKLYAVPGRVALPVLVGERGHVEQFTDLATLVSAIVAGPQIPRMDFDYETMDDEAWRAYDRMMYGPLEIEERPILSVNNLNEVILQFYETSAPAIYNDKTGLDRDALASYLKAVKAVSDKYGLATDEMLQELEYNNDMIRLASSMYAYGGSINQYQNMRSRLGYSLMTDFNTLRWVSGIGATQSWYDREWDEDGNEIPTENTRTALDTTVIAASGLSQSVFQPQVIAGVCSTSNNKALATDFISSMLTKDVQQYDMYDGLPVTSEGLAVRYSEYNVRDSWMIEEKIELIQFDYDSFYKGLDTAYFSNAYLLGVIHEHTMAYCKGEASLEAAVNAIASETEMYFAERQ